MKREIVTLSAEGLTLASLEERVATAPYRGFPVVESTDEPVLLGLIDKADILVAICKMSALSFFHSAKASCPAYYANQGVRSPDTPCIFSSYEDVPPDCIDFRPWVSNVNLPSLIDA